jgi:hypothetical protein
MDAATAVADGVGAGSQPLRPAACVLDEGDVLRISGR